MLCHSLRCYLLFGGVFASLDSFRKHVDPRYLARKQHSWTDLVWVEIAKKQWARAWGGLPSILVYLTWSMPTCM